MNNEFEDFDKALSSVVTELNAWDVGLTKNVKLLNDSTDAKKLAAQTLREEEDRRKALSAATKATIGQIGSFAKSLSTSGGSFEPMAQAVEVAGNALDAFASAFGPVGAILGAVFNATAQVTSTLIRSMDKAYGTFEKISQSGVVSSFSDMQEQASLVGLNLEDFQKVFAKNSKDLALIGGSAVAGTKEITNLGMFSSQLRTQMQRLGVSFSDMTDLQISALTQQSKSQGSMIRTNSETVRITDEYISNLVAVARLTGMSVKDQDEYNKQLQNSAYYRLGIQANKSITEEGQKAIKFFLTAANAVDPQLSKILEEAIVRQGAMTSKEGQQFATMMGEEFQPFLKNLELMKSGKLGGPEETGKLARAMKKQLDNVIKRVGQDPKDPLAPILGGIMDYIQKYEKMTQKDYDEERINVQTQKDKTDDLNGTMSDTKTNMYKLSQQMEQLSTNSDMVAGLMDEMSYRMRKMSDSAYESFGGKKSEYTKIQEELEDAKRHLKNLETPTYDYVSAFGRGLVDGPGERSEVVDATVKGITGAIGSGITSAIDWNKKRQLEDARTRLKNAQQAAIDADIKYAQQQNAEIERQRNSNMNNSTGAPSGAPSGSPQEAPPVAPSNAPSGAPSTSGMIGGPKDPGAYSGLNIGGSYPGEAIAGGPSSAKLIGIARQMQAAYPGGVFNAFNDSYSGHKNSPHSKGLAFDFSLPGYPRGKKIPPQMGQQIIAQLKSWGASSGIDEYNNASDKATGGHIHAQVSARTGGILSSPGSDYITQLHGDELVIPSDNGVAKQALNINNLQSNTDSSEISSLYKSLGTKMSKLVDLMESSVNNDKKHLRSSMA